MENLKPTSCEGCGLHKCTYVPYQQVDEAQYPILLVGQAPGHIETMTRIPFTGPAGKVLWKLLNAVGIDKTRLNITNIAACAPPEDREPTQKEIDLCHNRLKEEIHQVQPKLIVALGEVSANELTGKTKIQSLRGQLFPLVDKFDYKCEVLCLLHPAFIMRQRQWINIASSDVQKINEYFSPIKVEASIIKPNFIYDPSDSELAERLAKMSNQTTAVDIETPGELNILEAHVIGIAFCSDKEEAIGLDLASTMRNSERWLIVKRFLEDEKAKKCTQNGAFDSGVLETNGIKMRGLVYDTLLAEHTMNSDLPGNLDFLRGRYTKIPQYKPGKRAMKNIADWEGSKRVEMNCWDVVATLEVMKAQMKVMAPSQMEVLTDIELPLIDVCNSMERKGVLVDVNMLALLYKDYYPRADAFEQEYFAPLGVNPRSPKQLKQLFNLDTTGEEELEAQIKRGHSQAKLMEALLHYRELQKISSVYLMGVYERLVNNRIHAHPKIDGTGTGRLSYKNPNLQNVPPPLRVIYIPDDEDHIFIEADYNQLEVRVAANVAPEPTMLQQLAEGKSIHHIMGLEIFNKSWDELTKIQQNRAKAVVFGTFYGRTPRSIAIEFAVPIKVAEEWQTICFRKYPGLQNYIKRQKDIFLQNGKCSTSFGRIRYTQTVTQAFNTPIQSSAADVCLTSLIKLHEKGFDLRITVHDSAIIQAEKKIYKDVLKEFRAIMERPIKQLNDYQFPTKVKIGANWFELEEAK